MTWCCWTAAKIKTNLINLLEVGCCDFPMSIKTARITILPDCPKEYWYYKYAGTNDVLQVTFVEELDMYALKEEGVKPAMSDNLIARHHCCETR